MVLSPLVLVLRGLGIGIGIEGQNFDSIGIGIGIEGPSIDFWYWYWYWYCNPWAINQKSQRKKSSKAMKNTVKFFCFSIWSIFVCSKYTLANFATRINMQFVGLFMKKSSKLC